MEDREDDNASLGSDLCLSLSSHHLGFQQNNAGITSPITASADCTDFAADMFANTSAYSPSSTTSSRYLNLLSYFV